MPIDIEKKFDLKQTARLFQQTIAVTASQLLADAVAEMLLRIRSGRDVNNSMMDAYSEKYRIAKAKSGRSVSPPDITWSGLTLSSIQHRIENQSNGSVQGVIFFGSPVAAERARGNIDRGRDFYGLSDTQKNSIETKFAQIIGSLL